MTDNYEYGKENSLGSFLIANTDRARESALKHMDDKELSKKLEGVTDGKEKKRIVEEHMGVKKMIDDM